MADATTSRGREYPDYALKITEAFMYELMNDTEIGNEFRSKVARAEAAGGSYEFLRDIDLVTEYYITRKAIADLYVDFRMGDGKRKRTKSECLVEFKRNGVLDLLAFKHHLIFFGEEFEELEKDKSNYEIFLSKKGAKKFGIFSDDDEDNEGASEAETKTASPTAIEAAVVAPPKVQGVWASGKKTSAFSVADTAPAAEVAAEPASVVVAAPAPAPVPAPAPAPALESATESSPSSAIDVARAALATPPPSSPTMGPSRSSFHPSATPWGGSPLQYMGNFAFGGGHSIPSAFGYVAPPLRPLGTPSPTTAYGGGIAYGGGVGAYAMPPAIAEEERREAKVEMTIEVVEGGGWVEVQVHRTFKSFRAAMNAACLVLEYLKGEHVHADHIKTSVESSVVHEEHSLTYVVPLEVLGYITKSINSALKTLPY